MLTSLHLNANGYEYQYGKMPSDGHIALQVHLLLRDCGHASNTQVSGTIWGRIGWRVADYTEDRVQHELLEALNAY